MEMIQHAVGKIPSLNGTIECHKVSMCHGIAISISVGGGALQREFVSLMCRTWIDS